MIQKEILEAIKRLSTSLDKLNATQIEKGTVSITPSAANTPTGKAVTFSNSFSGTPVVVISASTAYIGTVVLGVSVADRSKTGFTAYVTRASTSDTSATWVAVY